VSNLLTFPILAQGLISGILQGGVYALTALGLTLIFGVMRIINIAHGTVLMIGAYLTYWLFTLYGLNPFLSLLASIPAAFLLGALLQRALIRPVIGAPELTALLVTFGISIILTNLALYIWAPDVRTVSFLSGSLRLGELAFSTPRTVASVSALGITAAALLFLKYSRTGKAIRATAQHREVAKVCGIDVQRIDLITFGLGSALAAAAGSLVSFMFAIYPEMGPLYTLKAFSVVILGGLGSSLGALLGGLVLGVAESYASIFFNAQIAEAVAYVLLVLILLVRPQGLLGEAAKE
jgi:branched-chain amino acid transport system permease protein